MSQYKRVRYEEEEDSGVSSCMGCVLRFGPQTLKQKRTVMHDLYQIVVDNPNMPEELLASVIEKEYRKRVYEKALENGREDVCEWTKEEIMEHLTKHVVIPIRIVRKDILTLLEMEEEIRKDGSDTGVNISNMLAVMKTKQGLLKEFWLQSSQLK